MHFRFRRDTRDFLIEGIAMNRKVAEAGLQGEGSLNIGLAYWKLLENGWMGNDLDQWAKLLTSAAVDARMSGCSLPVMTSAGSGFVHNRRCDTCNRQYYG